MEVVRSKESIFISQRKYTLYLLTETSMLQYRSVDNFIELIINCILENSSDKVPVDKEKYQCLVEKLIYLLHTRSYISYDLSAISQFMQALYKKHMEAVNII